jgi:UDP-GlcNAc:undecaprenyl-phosphate/decaprenyl-phosphate GlcNAc-1-phosphate transferase
MRSYLAVFVAALVAGLIFTPLIRALAIQWRAFGPGGARHIHGGQIPRLGGLALALGWFVPFALILPFDTFTRNTLHGAGRQLFGVVVGSLILCVVGAVDDVRGLRVAHKVAAQLLVGCLAYACGFRIEAISLPLFGTLSMGIFALPITLAWIVGITNALNLIDGLDGLAAGVAFFAALTGMVVAHLNGSPLVVFVLASLMGVLLAFLCFNFNPARIFMGDSGSYFLGYLLATTALTGALQQKASTAVSLLVPMIALGLPIFDTLFSMFRRFVERRPIFAADRGHVHHRLLELGLTHRRAVMLLYGVSVTFAGCAITVSLGRSWVTGGALFAASAVLIGLVRFAGYFEYMHRSRRHAARFYDATTLRLRMALPDGIVALRSARSEADVLDALRATALAGGVSALDVRANNGVVQRVLGSDAPVSPSSSRSSYPVGADSGARAHLDFFWAGDQDPPSSQTAILLQLLVDAAERAFERCGSPLAAEVALEPEPSERPAVVAASSSRA